MNSILNATIEGTRINYKFMLRELEEIQRDLDGSDIDVRLCIDFDGNEFQWIIRTGDGSYDPRHSVFCGAGGIDHDSHCERVLESLIDQVCDQASESDAIRGAK